MITAKPMDFVPANFLVCASCLLPERPQPIRPAVWRWDAPAEADGAEGILLSPLTPAEKRVLGLMLTGLADKEIASALGRALPTVKHQAGAVLRKHRVPSRARLIAVMRGGNAEPKRSALA